MVKNNCHLLSFFYCFKNIISILIRYKKIKKKVLNTTKIDSRAYSPNRNTGVYPGTSFKKNHEESWDIKTIKSEQLKMNNIKFNRKEDKTKGLNCITENNENN